MVMAAASHARLKMDGLVLRLVEHAVIFVVMAKL